MSDETLNKSGQKEFVIPNTFQPRTPEGRILSRTYQPQGESKVPKVIPALVSGVAVPPPAPASSQETTKITKK